MVGATQCCFKDTQIEKSLQNIKVTTNRHRASTWYASLEIAPHDRELFF